MKTIACYPMKSLVHTFLPDECVTLAVENFRDCLAHAAVLQPKAIVLFTETFAEPVWEWLPALASHVAGETIKVIVPLHRDEPIVSRIVWERQLAHTYLLPAGLSFEEIRRQLTHIFGFSTDKPDSKPPSAQSGKRGSVYSLISYGSSGVTTFCINFPVLLGRRYPDLRIAVVDMNAEKADLSRYFQLDRFQLALFRPDLIHPDKAAMRDWQVAFRKSEHARNVYYSSAAVRWKSYEVPTLLEVLRANFDVVFLDCGYCFLETEALRQFLIGADYPLMFVRADPFSLEAAEKWVRQREREQARIQLVISHCDKHERGVFRVRETGAPLPVWARIPLIEGNRMIQSLQNKSVLIEEVFPPKEYLNSLKAIAERVMEREEAAVSQ